MNRHPFALISGVKETVLRTKWRWLVGLTVVVGLGAWVLLTFSIWLFVKYRRDFSDVKYADLVWPGRWPQYRVSQGNHYITQGETLIQQGEITSAAHKLLVGVRQAPGNMKGRLLLARAYLACRRPDLAKEVLLDGLPYLPDDPAYLQTTLAFLLEFHEDTKLLEVTSQLLATRTSPAIQRLVATFAATAAYYRGSYEQAEDLLERYRLGGLPEGAMLQARIAWERGFPELAVLQLKELLSRHPGHDSARALLADYYHSLDRTSEWESALVERVTSAPLAPAPRVAYLQLHHRRGDEARRQRETAAFLQQFSHNPAALLLLGDYAASTGQPVLARRVQEILAARPENAGATALMIAEAHLVAGEYQPALDLMARYTRESPEWAGPFASVLTGLQVIALSGLGRQDEARLSLDYLLAQKNLRSETLTAVAGHLSALGARELALSALGRAVDTDALNPAALASLIRLELETGALANLPAHLERFLHTRQPSRKILAQAHATLGSDRHLLLPAQKQLLASLHAAANSR